MEVKTDRLKLIPLTFAQLKLYLISPEELEQTLGFPISRGNISDPVRKAINIKLSKMVDTKVSLHPWYTYWLIVVADKPYGAGLIGFKGYPDANGEAEIGYGIDPAYQNQGYITAAVKAMIAWAFTEDTCSSVIASVDKSNVASGRVLEKVGMHIYEESDETVSWRIDK
jgi:hypothetical protein